MSKCKFCYKLFKPRPQVKHPVACSLASCQRKRQRENEQDWHRRNSGKYDSKYHSNRRKFRQKIMLEVLHQLVQSILVGAKMLNLRFQESIFLGLFANFFLELGTTRINKFWGVENPNNSG